MKKILSLTLAITLASIGSVALADDSNVTIWVSKAGENSVKICKIAGVGYDTSKYLVTVPIKFDSDASWDNVKRTYSVSPEVADSLAAKKEWISVGSDGTAKFYKKSKK